MNASRAGRSDGDGKGKFDKFVSVKKKTLARAHTENDFLKTKDKVA